MALERLARELEETARQTAEMAEGITAGLTTLSEGALACGEARARAIRQIVMALQMQDRIEQRCRAMADAARRLASLSNGAGDATTQASIWSVLELEELGEEGPQGKPAPARRTDIELF